MKWVIEMLNFIKWVIEMLNFMKWVIEMLNFMKWVIEMLNFMKLRLAFVDRKPLFAGVVMHRFDCTKLLVSQSN